MGYNQFNQKLGAARADAAKQKMIDITPTEYEVVKPPRDKKPSVPQVNPNGRASQGHHSD
jgi:hypothetical protein